MFLQRGSASERRCENSIAQNLVVQNLNAYIDAVAVLGECRHPGATRARMGA